MLVTDKPGIRIQYAACDRRKKYVRGVTNDRNQTDGRASQMHRGAIVLKQREVNAPQRVDGDVGRRVTGASEVAGPEPQLGQVQRALAGIAGDVLGEERLTGAEAAERPRRGGHAEVDGVGEISDGLEARSGPAGMGSRRPTRCLRLLILECRCPASVCDWLFRRDDAIVVRPRRGSRCAALPP